MAVLFDRCCCLSLRTGVLIIGYLHAGVALIFLLMHLALLIQLAPSFREGQHVAGSFLLSNIQGMLMLYFGITVSLIYGATKGNRYCLIPFVSIHAVVTTFLILLELLTCIFLVSSITGSTIAVAHIALDIFVVLIVISHHQELKKVSVEGREPDEVSIVNAIV